MSAPLRDVLVKRPGAGVRARLRRSRPRLPPPGRSRRRAQREHDAFVETLAALGPRVHVLDAELDTPGPRLHVRPAARHRPWRDPAPAGQAEPGAPSRPRSRPGRGRPGSRRSGGSRRPARSRAATRSGSDRTCSASGGRCARTRRAPGSWPALVGGDVRIFDVPYWRGPAELIHLMSVISPVADDLAVVYLPLLPVGLWELLARAGASASSRCPTRSSRRSAATCWRSGPGVVILADGQSADVGRAGRRRLRGPHVSGDRDRPQRVGRADVHDPADPP